MRLVLALTLAMWTAVAMAETAPSEKAAPDRRCPPETKQDGSRADLSDKLAQARGVICPPGVDPQMTQPPPAGGAITVVPPPGTPGGNPNVQPK